MTERTMVLRFTPLLAVGAILLIMVGSKTELQPPAVKRPTDEPRWTVHTREVDEALGQKNLSAAEMAWHDAYGAALASRHWEAMLDVGSAYLRIAAAARTPTAGYPNARKAFLDAFFRARQQGSLDGVLRVAEAFAGLGDSEVAAQCLAVAEAMAARGGDPQAPARVRALREGLVSRPGGGYPVPNAF